MPLAMPATSDAVIDKRNQTSGNDNASFLIRIIAKLPERGKGLTRQHHSSFRRSMDH
jgi:hypothetical protein